jgi:hypothetical protein
MCSTESGVSIKPCKPGGMFNNSRTRGGDEKVKTERIGQMRSSSRTIPGARHSGSSCSLIGGILYGLLIAELMGLPEHQGSPSLFTCAFPSSVVSQSDSLTCRRRRGERFLWSRSLTWNVPSCRAGMNTGQCIDDCGIRGKRLFFSSRRAFSLQGKATGLKREPSSVSLRESPPIMCKPSGPRSHFTLPYGRLTRLSESGRDSKYVEPLA